MCIYIDLPNFSGTHLNDAFSHLLCMLTKAFAHILALHGQDFRLRYPEAFQPFRNELVYHLYEGAKHNPRMKKTLTDLVGQPSLLTKAILAKAFLESYFYLLDSVRKDFIEYGWGEAIEEGLKEEYTGGGKRLWKVITRMFPGQFPSDYPPHPVRKAALEKFRSKQKMEREWINVNVLPFQRMLLMRLTESVDGILPRVLMAIVYEYATVCTWIDTPEAQGRDLEHSGFHF